MRRPCRTGRDRPWRPCRASRRSNPRGDGDGVASPAPAILDLWTNMGKSLAEASGQTQGQDSPHGRLEPSTAGHTAEKIPGAAVNSGDGRRDSAQSRESLAVKLLAKFVQANKPRCLPSYIPQQTLLDSN